MEQSDILNLIKGSNPSGVWADLGSGQGAFTLALRELAGPKIEIYSVDKSSKALKQQAEIFSEKYPDTKIHFIESDFTASLELPKLDGLLMANSLHFVKDKSPLLQKIRTYLKPGGKLVIVEYDTDWGGFFVPYPLSSNSLKKLLEKNSFADVQQLATAPSRYKGQMYSMIATF